MANPWERFTPNHVEEAIAAEKLPEHKANFVRALHQQESSGRQNAPTSNAGAVGPMQIQPGTFKANADKDWDITNPAHSTHAAVREAVKQYDAANGDPVVAAAGYYGGAGGRIKAAKGIPVSDPRNPNAPNTLEYGQKVAANTQSAPWSKFQPTLDQFKEDVKAGMSHIPTSAEEAQELYYQQIQKRGPEAMHRYLRAKQMSPISKILTSAGNETMKLGAGAGELGLTLGEIAAGNWADKLNKPELADWAYRKGYRGKEAITDWMANQDITSKEFNEQAGIPGVIGQMLPYIISNESIGKPIAQGAGKLVTALTEIPKAVGSATRAEAVPLINRLAETSPTAAAIKRVITDPWQRNIARKAGQVILPDPFRKGMLTEALGGIGLGAVEGGLHYDKSIGEGAVNAGLGMVPGLVFRPALTRMPNFRNKTENDLIEWGKDQHMKFLPGMLTGSKRLQKFERGIQESATFADPMHRFERNNQIQNNRIAYEAMGIPKGKVDDMSPEKLGQHLDSLGKEYDKLEANTVAHFRPQDKVVLNRHVANLTQDQTQAGKSIANDAADYLRQIDQLTPQRNPLTGRMQSMSMEGSAYKDVRSRLQDDINAAYTNGDNNRARALKPIQEELDKAVERGIKAGKGEGTVQQWKDLNERYAMTNLVVNHGIDPMGAFAPHKILAHLQASDPMRLATERGGRIKNLYKAAKLDWMKRTQMGSDLTGLGAKDIYNAQDSGIVEKLLMSPKMNMLHVLPSAALHLYTKGYPVKTGLLGMSGEGFGRPSLYTRAYEQAQQPHLGVYNAVADVVKAIDQKKEDAKKKLKDFMK